MNKNIITLIISISMALSTAANSQTISTTFNVRVVVQPGTKIDGHTFTPKTTIDSAVINDAGGIAFVAHWLDDKGVEQAAIFTPQRIVVREGDMVEDNVIIASINKDAFIAISADGQVAYEAHYSIKFEDPGTSDGYFGLFIDHHLAFAHISTTHTDFEFDANGWIIPKHLVATYTPSDDPLPKCPKNHRGQFLVPVNFDNGGFLLLLASPEAH